MTRIPTSAQLVEYALRAGLLSEMALFIDNEGQLHTQRCLDGFVAVVVDSNHPNYDMLLAPRQCCWGLDAAIRERMGPVWAEANGAVFAENLRAEYYAGVVNETIGESFLAAIARRLPALRAGEYADDVSPDLGPSRHGDTPPTTCVSTWVHTGDVWSGMTIELLAALSGLPNPDEIASVIDVELLGRLDGRALLRLPEHALSDARLGYFTYANLHQIPGTTGAGVRADHIIAAAAAHDIDLASTTDDISQLLAAIAASEC